MANERHTRNDDRLQRALDKARANQEVTQRMREQANREQMPSRVAQALAPLLLGAASAGTAALATGGNPAATMAAGSAGAAAGTGVQSILAMMLEQENSNIRRREQEHAGQGAAVSTLLR